ncbi:peptidase M28 [Salinigranum rubrum]|uniref:Carboxypeptidase Q n=1 Tax=Salinigranum rubrum TaxID=755307 RepID=A0A2I8VGQ2_9EURY|nr:M28 family peptidase [Salinigranum rubrum]AUV81117.1 peptidase M28 [Salinigranum rubrum]
MTAWIGDTFTSDVGWSHLERLVDIGNRMAGTPGEDEALAATREALSAVGARDATVDPFPIQGWVRGDSAVDAGERTLSCIALPRSPSGSATGRLVDVGDGLPEAFDRDLSGTVVLVSSTVPDHVDRFIHRREKYYRAVEAGAAGFVFRNHVPGQLPPTGSVGTEDAPIGEIPAVGVSKEVGAQLARRHVDEDVTVRTRCETPDAESGNVHADVGPDTDEAVYLTSHVDAHDVAEGALDNGAGTAMVVEVARVLAEREDELDTRVHLACFGSEEVGLVGSGYHAERADDVRAVCNLDGVCGGRTLQTHVGGFDGLGDAFERVGERYDHPITVVPEHLPHSDHWPFVARGLPGCMVSAETGERGRGWGHTEADTLDKLEMRTFREQAVLLAEVVVELARADADLESHPRERIADALEDQGEAAGMRATGDWPF